MIAILKLFVGCFVATAVALIFLTYVYEKCKNDDLNTFLNKRRSNEMKDAKDRCNLAIGMTAIWTIVFAGMLICFVKWGSIFAAICMAFSYFKALSYANQAGFIEAGYKTRELLEGMEAALNEGLRKGGLSEDVQRKSTDTDQIEPVHKDDWD